MFILHNILMREKHTYLDVGVAVDEFNGIFKTPEAATKTFHQKISNRSRTALDSVEIMYTQFIIIDYP